jgi:hypothetical protein
MLEKKIQQIIIEMQFNLTKFIKKQFQINVHFWEKNIFNHVCH